MLKVEQADREGAAGLISWHNKAAAEWVTDGGSDLAFFSSDMPDAVRMGVWDEHDFVQAFAKHREDTALPLREVLDSVTYALIGLHIATGKKSDTADKAITQAMALLHPDTTGGE